MILIHFPSGRLSGFADRLAGGRKYLANLDVAHDQMTATCETLDRLRPRSTGFLFMLWSEQVSTNKT